MHCLFKKAEISSKYGFRSGMEQFAYFNPDLTSIFKNLDLKIIVLNLKDLKPPFKTRLSFPMFCNFGWLFYSNIRNRPCSGRIQIWIIKKSRIRLQEWVSGGIRTQHILKKCIKIDLGYTRKKNWSWEEVKSRWKLGVKRSGRDWEPAGLVTPPGSWDSKYVQ